MVVEEFFMSTRLKTAGRFTDGGKQLSFDFNGKQLKGVEGDTLASALLANDQMMVAFVQISPSARHCRKRWGRAERAV